MVYYFWKGIYCFRKYVIPRNPQTAEQQGNRHRFRFVSRVGVGSLVLVVRVYWNFLDEYGIGFNTFMKKNVDTAADELDFENLLMTTGNYEPVASIDWIKYKDIHGRCMFKWSTVISGLGSPDDGMILILLDWHKYDPGKKIFEVDAYINLDKIRADSVGFIKPAKELDTTFLEGYIATRGPGLLTENSISESKYKKVVSF